MNTETTNVTVSEDPLKEFFGSLLASVLIGTIEDTTKK